MLLDIKKLANFPITTDDQVTLDLIRTTCKIKCIIAPHHCISDFVIPTDTETEEYIMFPEATMSYTKRRFLINRLMSTFSDKTYIIVTADMPVIVDLISQETRLLKESGKLIEVEERLFQANIHDIELNVLKNGVDVSSEEEKGFSILEINRLFDIINSSKVHTPLEQEILDRRINVIGEMLIRNALHSQKNY